MRTSTRAIVLRRHECQQIDGIIFEKDIPKVVDESLAVHLLSLGNFQDVTGMEQSLLDGSEEAFNVEDVLTRLEPSFSFIPKPKNEIGIDDLNGKRLLFRRKGGIGDLVILGTVCQVIKNAFPDCFIHVGVQDGGVELISTFDAIDKATNIDATTLINVAHSFHYVVNFDGTLGSEKAGGSDSIYYFKAHFDRCDWRHPVPKVMPRLSIHSLIGNIVTQSEVNDILNKTGFVGHDYVVLLLGTSNPLKRMPPAVLQSIAETVSSSSATREGRERIRVMCLGGGDDRIFNSTSQWVHVETGLSHSVTCELIRRARCTIGADTGFLHFAAAIGSPVVGAWGPTVPELGIGNYDCDQRHAVESELECAPCKILRSAHCKYFSGGYADCMRKKQGANIPKLVDELLEANPDHFSRSIDPAEVLKARDDLSDKFRIAVILDYAKTYTGGGFYMWQTAKMLSELPMAHVTVFTDVPQVQFPYLQTDVISFGDKLSLAYDKDLANWQSSSVFDLVVAQPPVCGGAATSYAASRGAKSLLVVYETPNYIAQYRKGQDTGNKYWADYRDALDQADHVWCISKVVRDALCEWMPQLSKKKIQVIHPVINTQVADSLLKDNDEFYSHKTDTVVMIARNMSYKNLRETLYTLGDSLTQQLNRKLTIVVIGDRVKRLEKNIQSVWKSKVVLLEGVPEVEKWKWLAQAKLVVHPSDFEGFGIPVAEGLYAGAEVLVKPLPVLKECFGDIVEYYVDDAELITKAAACFTNWAIKEYEDGTGPHVEAAARRAYVKERYTKSQIVPKITNALKKDFTKSVVEDRVVLSDTALRIAYIGPWNAKCGIADTTEQFVSQMGSGTHIFSNRDGEPLVEDTAHVTRCWDKVFNDYRALLAQLAEYQPHVVHIQHEHSLFQNDKVLLEFMGVLRAKGVKVVITLHTYQPQRFTDQLRAAADAVISTKDVGEEGWHTIDLPVPSIDRVGRDEAISLLGLNPKYYVVGSFGMWQVHKGYSEFIETYSKVESEIGEGCRYLISASAPTKHQHLVETRRKYRLHVERGELILYTDYPELDVAVRRLEACSTLVFNYNVAHWTSSSAAIRTGMSAGVPIICTESPMFSEFEHERHVLKVPFGDRQALSEAILRLWADGELSNALVENCDAYLRACTPTEIARKHEALYHQLVFGEDKQEE